MPSLAEFQRDFAAALRAPAGSNGLEGADSIALRVHRNTVMKALIDALLANYPTLGVLMGREWLVDVARNYALQHPPRHAALADYGEFFPEFLRAMDVDQNWPYLAGVAALDRAWTRSLLAADAPALTPERLVGLAPESLGALQLRLHPATHFGVYGSSAVTVWMANRPPAVPPVGLCIDGRDEASIMFRNIDGVTLLPLDAAGCAFVEAVIAGKSIADAAGAVLQAVPGADLAGSWSTLLTLGVFADMEIHGD